MTPAAVLGSVVAVAIRSSASEHASAQFRVCHLDGHGLCGTVGGSEMIVAQAGATSSALHAECLSLLATLIFGGDGIDSKWKSVPTGPVDRLDHSQRGAWWGNISLEERARTREAKRWAGSTIAQQAGLDHRSGGLTAAGASTLNAWVVTYHKLVGALLAAISICGGAPSRGTELGALVFIDTLQARRDILVLGGEVVIMQHYSKTSSRSGVRLRPRFLLPETGELVVAFCRLVIPMRSFATAVLKRPIDCSGERSGEFFLFSGNEKAQDRARDHINSAYYTSAGRNPRAPIFQARNVGCRRNCRPSTDLGLPIAQ
jgi:hypothetical protein